jgi:hypothetical protein
MAQYLEKCSFQESLTIIKKRIMKTKFMRIMIMKSEFILI